MLELAKRVGRGAEEISKMTRNALLPLERKAAVSALAISSMIPNEPKVLDGKEA